MTRICIFTEARSVNIKADMMTIHGDMLLIYHGDELVGMFKESEVSAAYKTESKEAT